MILPLRCPVRSYAWGSTTALPELLGLPPTGEPQAELWIGAHPGAPAVVADGPLQGRALDELVRSEPTLMLGAVAPGVAGGRLSFLLKVLAVAAPLSIQVHPTPEQAEQGHAREEAAGVPLDAPERCYRDTGGKPELVVALSPFRALHGWADPGRSADLLECLAGTSRGPDDAPHLAPVLETLRDGRVREAARAVLTMPATSVRPLVAALVAGAVSGGTADRADVGEWSDLLPRLASAYPADPGVVLALLMRPVLLQPGEALAVGAGVPHCYLQGTAVEAQESSDNTLRGGLTSKHVDVGEFVRLVEDRASDPATVVPVVDGTGREELPGPDTRAFRLSRVRDEGGVGTSLPAGRAWSVVVTDGAMTLRADGDDGAAPQEVTLRRGAAAFVPGSGPGVRLHGTGTAFAVSAG